MDKLKLETPDMVTGNIEKNLRIPHINEMAQ